MAGTVAGGKLAAQKNMAKDPNFYKRIGAIGGSHGNTGGFAADKDLARRAGRIGGLKSRRRKTITQDEEITQAHINLIKRFFPWKKS